MKLLPPRRDSPGSGDVPDLCLPEERRGTRGAPPAPRSHRWPVNPPASPNARGHPQHGRGWSLCFASPGVRVFLACLWPALGAVAGGCLRDPGLRRRPRAPLWGGHAVPCQTHFAVQDRAEPAPPVGEMRTGPARGAAGAPPEAPARGWGGTGGEGARALVPSSWPVASNTWNKGLQNCYTAFAWLRGHLAPKIFPAMFLVPTGMNSWRYPSCL